MTPKQILDSFSETLMQDERILSVQERALLTNLLQHAKTATGPEVHSSVKDVIASAVGETVAQRAFAILGSSIVDRILAPVGKVETQRPTIYAMPGPQPPGPQPPAPSPTVKSPIVPATAPQPEAPPLTDTPSGPQPPGAHGVKAFEVRMHSANNQSRAGTATLDKPELLPAQFVLLEEFLSPQEMEELTLYTLQHETDFETSEVITPAVGGVVDYEHRRSRVLMNLGKYEDLIVQRVKNVLPSVLSKLEMEAFPVSSVEAQITASNDGDFFREHPDNGHEEVASRHLTFVYFFHREPRRFEGGELHIHDAGLVGDQYVSTGQYKTIVPRQNQIVFFPCSLLHEITPVRCPSHAFGDSRFTLNGWLRR